MQRRYFLLSVYLILITSAFAQNGGTSSTDSTNLASKNQPASTSPAPAPASNPIILKPIIGLGSGLLSFYGDKNELHIVNPQTSRIGFDLSVSQKMTDYLTFSFYVMFGKLGVNERSTDINFNFESQIRLGGIHLEYNFDNFFKNKDRKLSPWIATGFESFEFLTKTDVHDANGNKYYFWSDGSIRNIDQSAPNAGSAVIINRDYTYDTDVRESNINGYGKYPERSFAIPIGAGVLLHMSKHVDFKVGTTLHYTFTDYIDGLPLKDAGSGKHQDKFLMSSFQLRWDLFTKHKDGDTLGDHHFDDVDFYALDMLDSDKDGVPDTKDSCMGTPPGVAVDAKGCPLDSDHDGVPDYLDKEADTPPHSIVDQNGVALSDSTLAEQWDRFNDSTNKYAVHVTLPMSGNAGYHPIPKSDKEYTVVLGTYKKGLSTTVISEYLSIEDIGSTNLDDSTTAYTAGKFDNALDAEKRKRQLVAQGFKDAKVASRTGNKLEEVKVFGDKSADGGKKDEGTHDTGTKDSGTHDTGKKDTGTHDTGKKDTGTKDTGTKDTGTKDTGTKDTGTKDTGTKDTGTKDTGTKDTGTKDTGKKDTGTHDTGKKDVATTDNSEVNKAPGVVFRIQLGAFKNRISLSTFKDVPNVIEVKTQDGLYKYMAGSYKTFDDAAKAKVDILTKGYSGAFIAAYKDGKRVSLTDVGAIPASKKDVNPGDTDPTPEPAVKKEQVIFKVQVGAFKSEPPADVKAKMNGIKDLQQTATSAGLIRYTAGSFNDYKEAQKYKDELIKKGLDGAFIIAFFKGEPISIQEALELLK